MIATVERGSFVRSVRGPGRLVPKQTRWVTSKSEATVEEILTKPGASVTSDSIVIVLSNPDVRDRLVAASAALRAAEGDHAALLARLQAETFEVKAELAASKGNYQMALVEEEAGRRALERQVISKVAYKKIAIAADQFRERAQISEQKLQQARLSRTAQASASQIRLNQLREAQESQQLLADALHVRAGIDGTIQQVNVEPGQRVTAGFNLARVALQSGLIAEIRVPESQAQELTSGQVAVLEVGRARVNGVVERVNPAVENGTIRVRVYPIEKLPEGARPDQSIDGFVVLEEVPDALYVQRPIGVTANSTSSVFRLSRPDNATRVEVRFGKDSVGQVQVLNGLSEGDSIIVSDVSSYITNESLRLKE
ncbi:HlyD family efflux transporter periplasmic adaptor subunit [Silanimonas sp.]|uniref:efflux RND transporter periplasmic adaptor subunit n=1 Tax=Silanimonas sp. TaxID=1929290 RepID=UPI001BC56B30|nr:HlyD family efflux transporter periplasmic adaptor subunit [Silanimonas sp.]MBS3895271.1 HlyD family efflux transporter periplasmic adaptor subunit [Silanimonas sp.]